MTAGRPERNSPISFETVSKRILIIVKVINLFRFNLPFINVGISAPMNSAQFQLFQLFALRNSIFDIRYSVVYAPIPKQFEELQLEQYSDNLYKRIFPEFCNFVRACALTRYKK